VNSARVAVLLLSLGTAMGVLLSIVAINQLQHKTIEQQPIEWLATPRNLVSFSLESETGELNNQSLIGRWTIVSFGFLQCSDVCPTSLMQLSTLADNLAEESIKDDVAFIFVSVDPKRDSVVEISQFVRHFSPSFLGVTGSEEQLTKFAGSLAVQFKVIPDKDNYTVAHSTTFSIIDPEGNFRGRFRPGFNASSLAKNFITKL
jgi:protein SCO1/2